MRTSVYVDGFNLYHRALQGSPYRWLDLMSLVKKLHPQDDIVRIRYFTANVKQFNSADRGQVHQAVYLRALRTIPNLSIHLGQFRDTPKSLRRAAPPHDRIEVLHTEEKGSDVNLACNLLLDAFRDDFEQASVITNDSDQVEAIRMVREQFKKPVGILCPEQDQRAYSAALQGVATFFRPIRAGVLATSLFPPTLVDANGKTIRKPQNW